ncbi:MAG: GntR family transcriptional regulator [Lachnospiraceae bacterium]|nr:GntR family transcriptional regulator [Lachnospiraceae bacterium]
MELHPMIKANLSSTVKNYLYQYIRSTQLQGNTKLPPENVISANLGVSRVTVRRALDELEKEGVVLRIHGRGTFVNPEAVNIRVNLMPGEEFTRLIEASGYEGTFEIVDIRKVEADQETMEALQLKEEPEIIQVEKLYRANGHPAIISIDRFPAALMDKSLTLDAIRSEFLQKSTFDVLRQYGGVVVVRDKIQIETMNRKQLEDAALGGSSMECDSVLVFHGINYDQGNVPVIYDSEFYDTNFVKFSLLRVKNVYSD